MRYVLLILSGLFFGYTCYSQKKDSALSNVKNTDLLKTTILLNKLDHNHYSLNYLNGMNGKGDIRSIVFKNEKEVRSFISSVDKSLKAKDGVTSIIVFPGYKIRLLTEMGGVFMIVNETGKPQATFRITRENYDQMSIL